MRIIKPMLKDTERSDDLHEWAPSSFDSFQLELDHLIKSCEGQDPAPLYRGQTNYEWAIDSTFVRNCIQDIFGLPKYSLLEEAIRHSVAFHRTVAALFLLKFGTIWTPSRELLEMEKVDDIDPWFELVKNLQQYPEKDHFVKGTFLLDWSHDQDIALYFAIYEGSGQNRKISSGHGALWIYDAVATGNLLQIKKMGQILSLMSRESFFNGNGTFPLLFHPKRQTHQPRATNQAAIYIAQMDFRYDLADLWTIYERQNKRRVFVKFILHESLKADVVQYLEAKKITESVVYPE